MWYNRLSTYLLREGYVNNSICPCVFIKKAEVNLTIIAVYVDDLNLIGTPEGLLEIANYLKKEFEMEDLGRTRYCLGLQTEYLEPLTGNLFTARFAGCHFDESVFPPLGGDKPIYNKWREITWNTPSLLHLDPRTKQFELEVQRILHLQDLADQLPDPFTNPNKVIKSQIPAVNTPAHIEIPIGDSGNAIASTSKPRLKRGRPIGSKDSFPRKRKSNQLLTPVKYSFDEINPKEPITIHSAFVELNTLQGLKENITRVAVTDQLSPMKEEISINYMNQGEIWDRRNTLVSNAFSFQVAKGIMQNNNDQEPQTINECRNRQDWEKWKEAIQA